MGRLDTTRESTCVPTTADLFRDVVSDVFDRYFLAAVIVVILDSLDLGKEALADTFARGFDGSWQTSGVRAFGHETLDVVCEVFFRFLLLTLLLVLVASSPAA